MKHLTTIMAVFLLMGCQTTNTTPNAVIEPASETIVEKPEEKQKEENEENLVEPNKVLQTMKPVMCADEKSVHKGLKGQGEEPIIIWQDQTNGYSASLWLSEEKKTITVIEYAGPGLGCFTSIGVNAYLREKYKRNIGKPVSWVLD